MTGDQPGRQAGVPPSGPASDLQRTVGVLDALERVEHTVAVVVYRGTHADVDGPVRVLSVAPYSDTPEANDAFQQCVRNWRNASSHPNIVTVHGWGAEPRPWVAVETDGAWDPFSEAYRGLGFEAQIGVLADAAEGLRNFALYSAAHHNFSPGAVWVADGADGLRGVVDRWGVERAVRDATDRPLVTPYTAPEQLDPGLGEPGKQTDVYAFGAVAYEVLTGEPPVPAQREQVLEGDIPAPSERASVPAAIDDALVPALATDPADRPDTVHTVAQGLRQAL